MEWTLISAEEMRGGERRLNLLSSGGFLLNFVEQYLGGERARGREEGLAEAQTVDIRMIIIIQLKGYSPTRSLKGGDEQFQAYHSTA